MRTRRTVFGSLVAAVVVTAALAGTAATAQAYYLTSTAEKPHTNAFTFPPRSPSFRPCIARSLTLPKGQYLHGAYIVHLGHRTHPDLEQADKAITISAPTTFNWLACRGWEDDIGSGRYQVRSTLERPGFKRSFLMTLENEIAQTPVTYGNGQYEWGGRIVRDCPGCTGVSR